MSLANGRATNHRNPGVLRRRTTTVLTNHIGSETASSEPCRTCQLADAVDGDPNHGNSFDISPTEIASPHRSRRGCIGVTATPDPSIQLYPPALSFTNPGLQPQTASNTYSGANHDTPSSLWNPGLPGFPGWLGPATPEFNPYLTPTPNSIGYPPVDLSATTDYQADSPLQLPGVYDFSAYGQPGPVHYLPSYGVYDNFRIVPGSFAYSNSFPCRHHFTAVDPQATLASSNLPFLPDDGSVLPGQHIIPTPPGPQMTIASSNQVPFLGTDITMAAPALPGQHIGMITTTPGPNPMASRVTPPGSNANANTYTCDYLGCGQRVARRGDLVRHKLKHGVPQYPCLVHGCQGSDPEGRTIIVTGGVGFMGSATSESILEVGGDVICLDYLQEPKMDIWDRIQSKAQKHGGKAWYYSVDVTSAEGVQSAISKAVANARYPLRGMIACHGISDERPALDYPMDLFRKVIDTNLNGAFICAQAAAQEMCKAADPKGGSIVLVASMSAHNTNKGVDTAAYNTSKSGVLQLARSLAAEWGSSPDHPLIRVNTLSPGYIRTPMTTPTLEKLGLDGQWSSDNMLNRLSFIDEYRGPILYLLSDASSFMTAADLVVDGGHTSW
ncbi:hypothetical protein BP6252_12510 [Coleophoma cylindrospora]|uniref:C2H2-type domain-containing protein n=1 Tax=Coleophoma cylindrospora TaxID=1849047 RepID=A0A3D8QC41_9HELO|nr:hypothetical protein BP6252_12510 [Coleophoma cylindrospora]